MATLHIKGEEFTLKFSIILDKLLNKHIKDEETGKAKSGREKLSGGIQKILPELIDMDVETLAQVFDIAMKHAPKDKQVKATLDEILEAIDERMNEDGDATKIFADVFEAIDDSAFSRNELQKFVDNTKLIKHLKSEELDEETAKLMLQRFNTGYERITNKVLFEAETTNE